MSIASQLRSSSQAQVEDAQAALVVAKSEAKARRKRERAETNKKHTQKREKLQHVAEDAASAPITTNEVEVNFCSPIFVLECDSPCSFQFIFFFYNKIIMADFPCRLI